MILKNQPMDSQDIDIKIPPKEDIIVVADNYVSQNTDTVRCLKFTSPSRIDFMNQDALDMFMTNVESNMLGEFVVDVEDPSIGAVERGVHAVVFLDKYKMEQGVRPTWVSCE